MDREEIKRILQENEYGYIPAPPSSVQAERTETNGYFCAGKAVLERVTITAQTPKGEAVFPITVCMPKNGKQNKVALLLNFSPNVPDEYLPAEEIIDRGWGFVSLCYKQVTDDSPVIDANARILQGEGVHGAGKIAMWAWSAMRVMDYLQTRDDIDKTSIAVVGHSRLGKTALLTAAFDERFAFCHSNDSGNGGAALFALHTEHSEHIADLIRQFPYWFCPNFANFVGKEEELPLDQDALLSLIAPRVLSVGSAVEDLWANPHAEFSSAKKASEAWKDYGKRPLVAPAFAKTGENYHDGDVGYYVRYGGHYLSREDWNRTLDFFDKKIAERQKK